MQRSSLLDDAHYRAYLAQTHPEMRFDDVRLRVASFIAPLDVREPMLAGVLRGCLGLARPVFPAHVTPLSLFLGTPFERYDQSHLLDETDDIPALRVDALEVAKEERLELVVVTNVRPDHPALGAWQQAGFVALPSFPDTVVDLETPRFDEHMMTLPQGDRSGMRRNIRRFDGAGHILERLHDSKPERDALFAAYVPFFERASVRWHPHTPEYFEGLAALDDRVSLTVARERSGDVIGFVVNFEDGDAYQAGRIGVRPDYHRRDAVYFRLLYHVLEEALEAGASTLSLEPTGYRMKRHLGARREPMVNLVLGVSPTWRLLLSQFSGLGRWLLSHLDDDSRLERSY